MIFFMEGDTLICIEEDDTIDYDAIEYDITGYGIIDNLLNDENQDDKDDIKISIATEDKIKLCETCGGDAFALSLEERLDYINDCIDKLKMDKDIVESIKADYINYKKYK